MFTKTLKPAAVIAAAAIAFSGALLSATPAVASGLAPQATVATTQLPDFVQLVEKYGKGVVNISTVREARVVEGADPFGFDERPRGNLPPLWLSLPLWRRSPSGT